MRSTFRHLCSCGSRPWACAPLSRATAQVLLKPHLLDLSTPIDAYGKLVCVQLPHYVRDEEKFPDLATLTAAIAHDSQQARAYFAIYGL